MFKSLNTNKGIFTTLGITIIVVSIIVLVGTILIWKYRFIGFEEEMATTPNGVKITFSEDCNELSKQLYDLVKEANYCNNDPECLLIEHNICSLGPYIFVNRGADLTKLYEGIGKFQTNCPVCDRAPLTQEQKEKVKCLNNICVVKTFVSEVDCTKTAESFVTTFPDFFENIEKTIEWCNECVSNNGRPYLGPFTGPFCNQKTLDAGKICTDSSQCQGNCLGKDENSMSGLCSDVETMIGCLFQIENGKARKICYD